MKRVIAVLVMVLVSRFAVAGGVPVIDVTNLATAIQQFQQMTQQYQQMIQQYNTLQSQLQNMKQQWETQKANLQAVTGTNPFSGVGKGTYWTEWDKLMSGQDLQNAIDALDLPAVPDLTEAGQESQAIRRAELAREVAAVNTQLANTESRFNTIETLIQKVDSAPNQKTATDLTARIAGEQAKLTNELIKVMLLEKKFRNDEAIEKERRRSQPAVWLFDRS